MREREWVCVCVSVHVCVRGGGQYTEWWLGEASLKWRHLSKSLREVRGKASLITQERTTLGRGNSELQTSGFGSKPERLEGQPARLSWLQVCVDGRKVTAQRCVVLEHLMCWSTSCAGASRVLEHLMCCSAILWAGLCSEWCWKALWGFEQRNNDLAFRWKGFHFIEASVKGSRIEANRKLL